MSKRGNVHNLPTAPPPRPGAIGDTVSVSKITVLVLQIILAISFLFALYVYSDVPAEVWNTPYIVIATMNAVLHPVGMLILYLQRP